MSVTLMREEKKSIYEYLDNPKATAALPSLKSVLDELELLTERNNVRIDEVTRLVRADPSMSLRVLRVANSAYYAPAEPLLDIQSAVLYIGFGTFRESVISARCIEKTCHIQQDVLDWRLFWTHAVAVGLFSMHLNSYLPKPDMLDESFYLMGLLHDIGKVVLAQLVPKEFHAIYHQAAQSKLPPFRLEMEHLGIDHGHLGSWYLQKQGIPPAIYEPVRFHHAWISEPKRHLNHACLISLADKIAHWTRIGESGNRSIPTDPFTSPEWAHFLKLNEPKAETDERQESILSQVEKIADLSRKMIG